MPRHTLQELLADLDDERAQKLLEDIMVAVKRHYEAGPVGPGRVMEVLKAVAAEAGVVLAGTAPDFAITRRFFDGILNAHFEDTKKRLAAPDAGAELLH